MPKIQIEKLHVLEDLNAEEAKNTYGGSPEAHTDVDEGGRDTRGSFTQQELAGLLLTNPIRE